MKHLLFFLLLNILVQFHTKSQLPDISLNSIDNEVIKLSDLNGDQLTVIDFWATWCKPCLIAIPELNTLYEDFSPRGVNFIGVNIDSPRNQSKVRPFAQSRGLEYDLVLDPDQEAMQEMNVVVVPTLLIFDRAGNLLFTHEGFKPGDQIIIREEIEKNLLER